MSKVEFDIWEKINAALASVGPGVPPPLQEVNDERDALIRNARESLAVARSTVIDLLTSPNDIYAKISILQDLDSVDDSLRRAQ